MKIYKADNYKGVGTTAQRNALTNPQAGWKWYNTDLYREDMYNGTIWIGHNEIMLTNKTGATSVEGKSCIISSTYDFSIENPGVEDNIKVIGNVVTGGVADGSEVAVAVNGILTNVLMQAEDNTVRGSLLFCYSNGENYSSGWVSNNTSGFGVALESKNDTIAYIIKGIIGLTAEIY